MFQVSYIDVTILSYFAADKVISSKALRKRILATGDVSSFGWAIV